MIKTIKEYKLSSYNQYIDGYNGKSIEIDMDIIKSYFRNKDSFVKYMNETNDDQCLEYFEKKKYTDVQLKKEIERKYDIKEINDMTKEKRDKLINNIKEDTGASIRQLSRVLGIGRGIIEKAVRA